MKVKCINNSGAFLRAFEYEPINSKRALGRFGSTVDTEYNELKVGNEYIVMGILIFKTYQGYLIDDNGFISVCPCQLFEITDNKLGSNWYYRSVEKNESIYPFVQAIFGYYELCFDMDSYENLILEKDKNAENIYFSRKVEFEKELLG